MTPYNGNLHFRPLALIFPLVFTVLGVTSARAADASKPTAFDGYTKSGFEHYYSLEYDKAVADFQKAIEASPEDARG